MKFTYNFFAGLYRTVKKDVESVFQGLLDDGWEDTLKLLHSRDSPPTAQFVKYVLCGFAATFVQLGLFLVLTLAFFPIDASIEPETREWHAILANLIAFPFANFAAYFLNIFWVFTPGRHSMRYEFGLFTLISFISFGAGLFGGPFFISQGLHPWLAQLGFIVTSALVNFVCRKFLIFLR